MMRSWSASLWLTFLVVASTAFTLITAQVDERSILLEFYQATGGHAWNENYGWAGNLPNLCEWHGVICQGEERPEDEQDQESSNPDERRRRRRKMQGSDASGTVVGLKLNANFLTGRSPASLWQLPSLVFLDVSYNPNLDVDFVGLTSDSRLEELNMRQTGTTSVTGIRAVRDSLTSINLSDNDLNTQFPADLYELTKLTILDMAECNLKGRLPDDIHRLSVLHELNLYKNSLTGTLPSGLSRLVHLRHLGLSFNQFHGTLPSFVNDMVVLEQFWITNNDFTGSIPSFHQSPDLYKLFLNGNSFSGDIPEDFLQAVLGGPNTRAVSVNLSHNEFSGVVPVNIDRLAPLEMSWKIGDNKWDGIPPELCDNVNWNNGNIEEFGCFGLACPPGTFSRLGYQTFELDCIECGTAEYYGATNCFDKDDISVLKELYIALGGEKWDRKDGWLQPGSNVCDWYGVMCWDSGDSKDGRVRWIALPNNNLQGDVPETIWSVEHMTTLDLNRNDIVLNFESMYQSLHIYSVNVAGTKTRDLDGIENANTFFKRLYADRTPMGGAIPRQVFTLSNLEVLSMQECDLSGPFPLALFDSMTSLQELYLANNNFQGDLPDRWDALPNLKVLTLAKNQFRGPLPATFGTSESLQAVSLQDQVSKGGGLTGTVPSYATSRTLTRLMLAQNNLDGELPEDFLTAVDGTASLITVDLAHNKITGTVHASWERFVRLDLFLEGNQIAEIDSGLCDNAEWMSGGVASFGCDAILCPRGTVGGRRQFTDGSCRVCEEVESTGDEEDDDQEAYLGQLTCAEEMPVTGEKAILELVYQQMGGAGWRSSENWMSNSDVCNWYGIDCDENGSIASIQLGSNQLVGSFPTEVYQLPKLKHLKLYDNTVYMSFEGIEDAENLETLSLDNTGLVSLDGIGQARSLRELSVGHNNLIGPLPEEVSHLINLKTFDLSYNGLSGFLPYWLRGMVSMTTFTASHNKFSGPVYDFASLRELRYLDLSYNQLTGSVPSTLLEAAPVDDKVVVDLSRNKIGGTVPADVARLTRLSLQLQDNRIEELDPALCASEGLNDYDVLSFGCNGILCPAGTYNHLGRQSNEDLPCEPCDKAPFMGSTYCGNSAAASSRTLNAVVALLSLPALLAWIIV